MEVSVSEGYIEDPLSLIKKCSSDDLVYYDVLGNFDGGMNPLSYTRISSTFDRIRGYAYPDSSSDERYLNGIYVGNSGIEINDDNLGARGRLLDVRIDRIEVYHDVLDSDYIVWKAVKDDNRYLILGRNHEEAINFYNQKVDTEGDVDYLIEMCDVEDYTFPSPLIY